MLKFSVSGTNFLVQKVNLAPQDWLLEIYCYVLHLKLLHEVASASMRSNTNYLAPKNSLLTPHKTFWHHLWLHSAKSTPLPDQLSLRTRGPPGLVVLGPDVPPSGSVSPCRRISVVLRPAVPPDSRSLKARHACPTPPRRAHGRRLQDARPWPTPMRKAPHLPDRRPQRRRRWSPPAWHPPLGAPASSPAAAEVRRRDVLRLYLTRNLINPRRTIAARVTVVDQSVCLSFCLSVTTILS